MDNTDDINLEIFEGVFSIVQLLNEKICRPGYFIDFGYQTIHIGHSVRDNIIIYNK